MREITKQEADRTGEGEHPAAKADLIMSMPFWPWALGWEILSGGH